MPEYPGALRSQMLRLFLFSESFYLTDNGVIDRAQYDAYKESHK